VVVVSLVQTTWAVVNRPDSVAGGGGGWTTLCRSAAHGTANPRRSRGGVFQAADDRRRGHPALMLLCVRPSVDGGGGGCYTCTCGAVEVNV